MKKLYFLLLLLLPAIICGQSDINNLDFEFWSGSNATGFNVSSGVSQRTLTPHAGTKYARITSNGLGSFNAAGYMGVQGTGGNTQAGVPCSLTPVSINGWVKTNLSAGDTLWIIGSLRKNYNQYIASLTYTTVQTYTNWTYVSLPFTYHSGLTPDTIAFTFISNKGFIFGHSPNASGTYMEVDDFSFSLPVGMNENGPRAEVSVFPVPAKDKLFINGLSQSSRIDLFNMSGQLVFTCIAKGEFDMLDLSDFSPGIYYYRINDPKDQMKCGGKLIVEN